MLCLKHLQISFRRIFTVSSQPVFESRLNLLDTKIDRSLVCFLLPREKLRFELINFGQVRVKGGVVAGGIVAGGIVARKTSRNIGVLF